MVDNLTKMTLEGKCKECGGQLKRITDKPVRAGNVPGAGYHIYQCQNCGKAIVVGGK